MGLVKREDIVGSWTKQSGVILCINCMNNEDWDNLAEDNIITEDEATDGGTLYFCDTCKKQLPVNSENEEMMKDNETYEEDLKTTEEEDLREVKEFEKTIEEDEKE